ncbi:MAG: hypothetical protein RLZZ399_2108, partial [Verrucomicrobiota bacterium]
MHRKHPAPLSFWCTWLLVSLSPSQGAAVPLDPNDIQNVSSLKGELFLKTVTQPERWKGAVLAEDPDIQSPAALALDEIGRVFVAETLRFRHGVEDLRFHLDWLKEDMALQSLEQRLALYQKYAKGMKGGMEAFTQYEERVRVLEAHGGRWSSKIFAGGFNDPLDGTAGGLFAFKGDLWFASIPSIWRLRASQAEGTAREKQSIHRGFGVGTSISGHDLNGFAMGMDGRLYFTVGDRGYQLTTPEGKHLSAPTSGAVFRMEMDGSRLEVIHQGLRNPKEVAFDRLGNLFSVDNNSDAGDRARVVLIVEGADSGWDRGHQNLQTFRRVWAPPVQNQSLWMQEGWWRKSAPGRPDAILPPADHFGQGPSGLTYFPGTGFDPKWDNMFLLADYTSQGEVKGFRMKPEGAGFVLESNLRVLSGINTPDVEFGYDGRLYVADRKSTNFQNQAGRLLAFWDADYVRKPEVTEVETLFRGGIENLPSQKLGELLGHPDMRVRLRSEWELSTRPEEGRLQFLEATHPEQPLLKRLHATYGLGILARRHGDPLARNRVRELTRDSAPILRARSVEILGDLARHSDQDCDTMLPLLHDPDAQVRLLAAVAIGKTGADRAREPLLKLLEQNGDSDAYVRHGAVTGLATLGDPDKLASFATDPRLPVRRGVLLALRRLGSPKVERFLNDPDPGLVREAIQAIYDARISEAYAALAQRTDLLGKLGDSLDNRLLGIQMHVGGDPQFRRVLQLASDPTQKLAWRSEATWILRNWEKTLDLDPVTGSFDPRLQALQRTISPKDRQELASQLLAIASTENGEFLPEILQTLGAFAIKVPTAVNRDIFKGTQNPVSARIQAFHAITPKEDLLETALQDTQVEIRMAGLGSLLKSDESAAFRQIDTRLKTGTLREKQLLIALLGKLDTPTATQRLLQLIESWSSLPPEILVDVWKASERRKDCEAHFSKLRASLKKDGDSLAEYRIALSGGNPIQGRQLFYQSPVALCSRCHKAEPLVPAGGAGPSLEGVAARGEEYLLRSLLE